MAPIALTDQAADLLAQARESRSGRAAELVMGGPGSTMTQTIIALRSGAILSEHRNPGEASVMVLDGQVRLLHGEQHVDAARGELIPVPDALHSLEARSDSAVLLTAVKLPE